MLTLKDIQRLRTFRFRSEKGSINDSFGAMGLCTIMSCLSLSRQGKLLGLGLITH
jgi:hypothetical protein